MSDLKSKNNSREPNPLSGKQLRFHDIISHFRNRLSSLQEAPLTVADIEEFYTTINNRKFRFSLFGSYYKKYIENLNRFKPVEENNFDVTFLKIAIAEDKWKPTKPYPVFIYHLKYKFKLTSFFFIRNEKKQNHKKLNPSTIVDKKPTKFNSEKEWMRVPLGDKKCKPGCGCSK